VYEAQDRQVAAEAERDALRRQLAEGDVVRALLRRDLARLGKVRPLPSGFSGAE